VFPAFCFLLKILEDGVERVALLKLVVQGDVYGYHWANKSGRTTPRWSRSHSSCGEEELGLRVGEWLIDSLFWRGLKVLSHGMRREEKESGWIMKKKHDPRGVKEDEAASSRRYDEVSPQTSA